MYKRNYIKLTIIFITVLLSVFAFLSTRYQYAIVGSMIVPISLIFSIPIFMNYKYKDIKNSKFKTLYLIIMIIFYILDIAFLFLMIFSIFNSAPYMILEDGTRIPTSNNIFRLFKELNSILSPLLFMSTSWLMIYMNFNDLEKNEDKVSFYLTIAVCIIINLIHINYYINPNLIIDLNNTEIGEKAAYITQNYIYFAIMYSVLIIKKLIIKPIE